MTYYYDDYDNDDLFDDGYGDYLCSLAEDGQGYCDYHDHVYELTPSAELDQWGAPAEYSDPGCPKCQSVEEMYTRVDAGEVDADAICYACEGAESETSFMGQRVCMACYRAIASGEHRPDRCRFAHPGGHSALRAAGPGNPRVHPCPSCYEPNRLTPQDVARGYQCDTCADRAEGTYRGGDY